MRKSHQAEIIVIVLSFVLGIIPIMYKSEFEDVTYIIWSIGIIIAGGILFLGKEIKTYHDQIISLYGALEKINDSGLFSVGKEAIQECEEKLYQLSRGEVHGHSEAMRYVNERLRKAKKVVTTTHLIRDLSGLDAWATPEFINWMGAKKEKEKEITFERYFLLDKDAFQHPKDCEEMKKLLQEQNDAGVKVKIIIWDEELQNEFLKEFIIYDSHSVIVLELAPHGKYGKATIIKDHEKVNKYKALAKKLSFKQQSLEDFLANEYAHFCNMEELDNAQNP
jgi:hypothetical protein